MNRPIPAVTALCIAACAVASAAEPNVGGRVASVTPEPPDAHTSGRRQVFSCVDEGSLVLSDRPCGPVTLRRELEANAPTGAPPAIAAERPEARAFSRAARTGSAHLSSESVVTAAATNRCDRLRKALASLDSRMRAGYTARESAGLWERRRAIKRDLHEHRC